jgi:hypothetical protein
MDNKGYDGDNDLTTRRVQLSVRRTYWAKFRRMGDFLNRPEAIDFGYPFGTNFDQIS